MDKKKTNRPKKRPVKGSILFNIREFISDNLRYILLAAAVIVVIIIIIAIVSGTKKGSTEEVSKTSSEVSQISTSTSSSDDNADTNTNADTDTNTSQSSISSEDAQVISDKAYTVISTYLTACASGDESTASSVCESLDEGTKGAIVTLAFPSSFANLVMYLYNGNNAGEYVAVCTYDYTDRSTGATLPDMSTFYLVTVNDEIKMASSNTTSANKDIIDEVLGYPEIVELVNKTNEAKSTGGTDAAA